MHWQSYRRYVAIGDSFTEGIGDPRPDGRDRGWADRVAQALGEGRSDFTYANLAIRGRKVHEIVAEQVPLAVQMGPDLVSFAGGINDALRRSWDLTGLTEDLSDALAALSTTGARIVIVTYGRPSGRSRLMGLVENRLANYREVTYELAGRYGAAVVDFWEYPVLNDQRFWSDDRLHLNAVGHQRVAMAVLESLGQSLPTPWWEPLPDVAALSVPARAGRDVAWVGRHLAPWVGRRLTGRSSGDGVTPKRPECLPLT